jgi:hypothetical protein
MEMQGNREIESSAVARCGYCSENCGSNSHCPRFCASFFQNKQTDNRKGSRYPLRAGFFLGLFFDPEDGGDVPPKRRFTFNRLHNVVSQKIELFITTAVRTSNTFIKEWLEWSL